MRVALAVLAAAVLAAMPADARPDVARGRRLAVEACSACHQVTSRQPIPAPVGDSDTGDVVHAPAFAAIALKYRHNSAGLRAFILAPDHPMREQRFLARDLSDIVAYIHSRAR